MKKIIIGVSIIFLSQVGYTQLESDCYCGGDLIRIKSDELGSYYLIPRDSNIVIYIANDYSTYRQYENNILMVEGNLGYRVYTDFFQKFGHWKEYYPEGKLKSSGYYYENIPVGLWRFFYSNGNLKKTYTLAIIENDTTFNTCMVGLYQEYYEHGQLKENGYYKSTPDYEFIDMVNPDPPYNTEKIKRRLPSSKKYGIWEYYQPNGKLEKYIDYNRNNR